MSNLGSRTGHPQIWEGPMTIHMFVTNCKFGGVSLAENCYIISHQNSTFFSMCTSTGSTFSYCRLWAVTNQIKSLEVEHWVDNENWEAPRIAKKSHQTRPLNSTAIAAFVMTTPGDYFSVMSDCTEGHCSLSNELDVLELISFVLAVTAMSKNAPRNNWSVFQDCSKWEVICLDCAHFARYIEIFRMDAIVVVTIVVAPGRRCSILKDRRERLTAGCQMQHLAATQMIVLVHVVTSKKAAPNMHLTRGSERSKWIHCRLNLRHILEFFKIFQIGKGVHSICQIASPACHSSICH